MNKRELDFLLRELQPCVVRRDEEEEVGEDEDYSVPDGPPLTIRRVWGRGWGGRARGKLAVPFRLLEAPAPCVNGNSIPRPTPAETLNSVCAA